MIDQALDLRSEREAAAARRREKTMRASAVLILDEVGTKATEAEIRAFITDRWPGWTVGGVDAHVAAVLSEQRRRTGAERHIDPEEIGMPDQGTKGERIRDFIRGLLEQDPELGWREVYDALPSDLDGMKPDSFANTYFYAVRKELREDDSPDEAPPPPAEPPQETPEAEDEGPGEPGEQDQEEEAGESLEMRTSVGRLTASEVGPGRWQVELHAEVGQTTLDRIAKELYSGLVGFSA